MKSFMAVTYHFINNDFQIVTGLLDFVKISGKHTGKSLAASLINIFEDFHFKKTQVFTITVDNASNNNTMMKELIEKGYITSSEYRIRCFAHILNLAAQDLLSYISILIQQLRINNKFICNSSQRMDQFELICKINHESFNKPQLDVKTRWNSTYDMLVANLKTQKSMNEFVSKQGQNTTLEEVEDNESSANSTVQLNAMVISFDDWELARTIIGILEPIKEATLAMSGSKYPTMSLMVPYFDSILDRLKDDVNRFRIMGEIHEDAHTIAAGAEVAYEKMLKYFSLSSDLAVVATVLDPRFKLEYHQNNPTYGDMVERCVSQMVARFDLESRISENSTQVNTSLNYHLPVPAFLRNKARRPVKKTAMDELRLYSSEASVEDGEIVPLDWWKMNRYMVLSLDYVFQYFAKSLKRY